MEPDTKSKRPLGITILMIWFVLEGIFYFYTNSIDGIFGSQGVLHFFRGSFVENTLAVYGFGLAIFDFFIVWCFMERKHWIRVPTILVFVITTGISGCLTFLGYVTVFEIIVITSLTAIIVIYLMKSNVKEYFVQTPSYSSTPVG